MHTALTRFTVQQLRATGVTQRVLPDEPAVIGIITGIVFVADEDEQGGSLRSR